ncbi:MAG TPA: hypothetical protein VGJ19_16715 [Streptosporangiaceae bacterium]
MHPAELVAPPLAYVVVGTDAGAVNTAKQRPAEQPAGLSLARLGLIVPYSTSPTAAWPWPAGWVTPNTSA